MLKYDIYISHAKRRLKVPASHKQKPGFYGWKNVTVLFFIYMLTMGFAFYGFSVIFPAMVKAMDWNRGVASAAVTLNMLLSGMLIPLVAVLIEKFGTKRIISIGITAIVFGLILLGTVTTQMWQWIILWGFILAFGIAFSGLIPVQTTLMYWFNVNRATAIGIVMSGAPIGGFIAQPLYTWLMAETQTWQIGWLSGAFFSLIALGLSYLIISKPEDVGQYVDGLIPEEVETSQAKNAKTVRTYRTATTWQLKEVLRTTVFWFVVIFWIGHIMPYFLIISHGVLHFTDIGFTNMQAASLISMVILGSGIARFPAGWLGDRIEPRWIITISMGAMFFMFILLWKMSGFKILIVTGMVFGLCHGSQLIAFPTLIGNYYGPDRFASINGAIAPFSVGFSAIVPIGGGYIFESTGSYNTAFLLLSIVSITAFIFSLFLSPPIKRR